MKNRKMQRVIEVKEGWNFHGITSEGRRRGSPIEGEAGRKESQWARLIGGFSGKDFMALEEGMETILPMVPGILTSAGRHMTLTRAGKRFFALEAGDATLNRLGVRMEAVKKANQS